MVGKREGQALWYVGPGRAELREEMVAAPEPGEVQVRALFGAVSRGTERLIHAGRVPHERGRRGDEMKAISGAHALLTNIVLAWNTHRMNDVIERLRKDGTKIEDAWLRRMGPGHFGHVNFRGIFSFGVERYADVLIQGRRAAIKQAVI